jgi:hypothetical protein
MHKHGKEKEKGENPAEVINALQWHEITFTIDIARTAK